MLTYGITLTQINDPLQKIELDKVVAKIKRPRPEFMARIEQLRRIKELNPKQYSQLKTGLPYFCCGIFNPPYRRKENFASIAAFTLDFDHFTGSGLLKNDIFQRLSHDLNIRLLFTSPGGDGLKALFELAEPCSDPGMYVHFYKAFAQKFVKKYELEKVIDWVTHDVARATFFSADNEAWDNPIAIPVQINEYISEEISPEFSRLEKTFAKAAKENQPTDAGPSIHSPGQDTLQQIKTKLNPNYRPKRERQIYVPPELMQVLPLIEEALTKENIKITGITSINYGKQLKVGMDKYWAELNVFYGQKGFSIVRSTKTGSQAELGELAYQIIDTTLNT